MADQGKSIILSAIGGTGKTTTVSMAMAYGSRCWALHADDYVFISPEKKRSYGYITRSHLYRSLLHWVPEISQTLTRWERVQLLIHDFILKLSNKHIRLPVRIELARIWERNGVCYEAEPIIIAKLLKGGVVKNQQANSTTDFADFLLNMNFEEARHYMTLIQKCGITGEHPELISRWIEDEKRLISQLLSVIPAAEVTLPKVGQKSKNMGKLINTLLDEMIDEQEAKKQP
ncbi:MAG: hypothetical protein JW750_03990 [Anaerolineaceae bacterium]|nr:hypothetical protein [Anaerolineaceae bacterium]